MLAILIIFTLTFDDSIIKLTPTGRTFQVEDENFAFAEPANVLLDLVKHRLYLIDEPSLNILALDYYSDQFFSFSNMGQAPGQLSQKIPAFYFQDEKLIVIHSNGTKTTSFLLNGKLIKAKSNDQALLFENHRFNILLKKGKFLISSANKIEDEIDVFDFKLFGYSNQVLIWNNFATILTMTSQHNEIGYVTVDMNLLRFIDQGSIQKTLKFSSSNTPALHREGMKIIAFYATNFTNATSHERWGIIIKEFAAYDKSETFKDKSVLKCYRPDLKKFTKHIISHPGLNSLTILLPLENDSLWIAYDSREDQFIWLKKK